MNNIVRRRRLGGTPATLADVARVAAVSTASASRALTRPEAVSEELRVRVGDAASILGYVANSAARALARRRSGVMGIVTANLDEPGMASALAALDASITGAGWALLLGAVGKNRTPLDAARALVGRGVEALVFLGVAVPADLGTIRGVERLPCVSVDRADAAGFTTNAGFDLARAARLVEGYLRELGHLRTTLVVDADSVIGALLADALRTDNGSAGPSVEPLSLGDATLVERIEKWFALTEPPTAAICGSDAIAVAVMHACARCGVDVPGRLSVVGFGDTLLARCVSPMLTSVRIPAGGAGIATAEYLLARMAGGTSERIELPVKLAVRGSTGPPLVSQSSTAFAVAGST